jgi:hypothetical protein
LDSFPEELSRKVFQYSANGHVPVTGIITALEVARRKNKNKRHMLFAAFGFFVAFVLMNMGLTYAVVNMMKETHIGNNGMMLQAGSSIPVATASARTVMKMHSELTLNELSELKQLAFSLNGTDISVDVQGFARFPCTLGKSCLADHFLILYTPDMSVVYHGSEVAFANMTSRIQSTFTATGFELVDADSSGTGRHLSGANFWRNAAISVGGGFLFFAGGIAVAVGSPVIVGVGVAAAGVGFGATVVGAALEFL